MTWSERHRIEFQAPEYLRNIIRIISETGLRVYKEVDLENAMVWIPDSKTPNGIAEVPLLDLAREASREQMRISGLRRAKVPYFRIYDLRSTYATRSSARRRGRRVGDATTSTGRCEGV